VHRHHPGCWSDGVSHHGRNAVAGLIRIGDLFGHHGTEDKFERALKDLRNILGPETFWFV
jgi:hypothetical protein